MLCPCDRLGARTGEQRQRGRPASHAGFCGSEVEMRDEDGRREFREINAAASVGASTHGCGSPSSAGELLRRGFLWIANRVRWRRGRGFCGLLWFVCFFWHNVYWMRVEVLCPLTPTLPVRVSPVRLSPRALALEPRWGAGRARRCSRALAMIWGARIVAGQVNPTISPDLRM